MLMPVETVRGEDEEETQLLKEMAERAREYVTSFHWCPPVKSAYLAFGIGKIIALFLFTFDKRIQGIDDKTWVVEGDLPPAFIPVQPEDSVQSVLEDYCVLMDDWVSTVRSGGDFKEVFPVAAERTEEHADMLEWRLGFLRKEVIAQAPTDFLTDASGGVIAAKFARHRDSR